MDLSKKLDKQIVRIDGIVLPPWAYNNHYFVFMNAMCLERHQVKEKLNRWIDLVFGVDQHSHECYNLFKPLTDEKFVHDKLVKNELLACDLSQISEFGHNPMRLFDDEHCIFQKKEGSVHSLPSCTRWNMYNVLRKENDSFNTTRIFFIKDNWFMTINAANQLQKRQLIIRQKIALKTCEIDCKIKGSLIYNTDKKRYCIDPYAAYSCSNKYIATCLNTNNTFCVYRLSTGELKSTISFHKSIVSAVCIEKRKLFTGDCYGLVAVWKLPGLFKLNHFPLFLFNDHDSRVVSIASSFPLDLYASASCSQICLRTLSTHKFSRTISLEAELSLEWHIFKVMLSSKGYIIVQLRSTVPACNQDAIIIYSINGVKVAIQRLNELLNVILLSPITEYFIVTSGSEGVVKQYSIITMEAIGLLDVKAKFPAEIIAMTFIKDTRIVVGLSNSTIKYIELQP